MTTPTDRIRNQKDLYASIREEHTREALRGLRWIIVHPSGIPIGKATTESVYKTFLHVERIMPSRLDEGKVQDLIKGGRISGREFLNRFRSGEST